MVLPSSGAIKMSEINSELGRSSNAQISLDTAENGGYRTLNSGCSTPPSSGNPAKMSEWYSYDQCCYFGSFYYDGGGNLGSDCGSYGGGGGYNVYSNNCGGPGNGCYIYSTDGGACSGVYNSYCFTDFGQYFCSDANGEIYSSGGCTT